VVAAVKLALTGGTGFVGSRVLTLATASGLSVNALTRRFQPTMHGVNWIEGALESREAMQRLVEDANAVIHVAGVVNAPDEAGFIAGNVTGTLQLLAAATAAGVQRFVHVSSLAAREPDLSLYGRSKAQGEQLVERSGLDWAIVRPPAVYGPGDREMLDLFKAARTGVMPLPPAGRLSAIHVDDLAGLLLALVQPAAPAKVIYEADDGRVGGYSHREFGRAIGCAVDRSPMLLSLPGSVLRLGGRLDRLFRRDKAKLTPDRAAYFCHSDWAADPAKAPPGELWQPRIALRDGLSATAKWYAENGWLPPISSRSRLS
jgi:nucleoside-diphosphate-sugar epimerase